MSQLLLKFAKLDFNMVQAIYLEELRDLSRWWTNLGFEKDLSFARDALVVSYLWGIIGSPDPQYGIWRRAVGSIIALISSVDDVYDLYGTLEEVELFTDTIHTAYEVLKLKGVDVTPYLKKSWEIQSSVYLKEARWFHSGYKPTLDEYMSNAWISVSIPLCYLHGHIFDSTPSPNQVSFSGFLKSSYGSFSVNGSFMFVATATAYSMAFKRFNPKPPPSSLPFPPQSTLPTITLSSSSTATYLSNFLHSHLKPSFTSQDLLFFLKSKLHHHPNFTQFDFHVFNWASNIDSFRHDHLTYQWITRTLAVTHRFNELFSVLDFIFSNPCPCSDGIFSCPRTEDIFRFSLNAFCRVGRLDDALKVFDKMRKMIDGKPNVAVYNMLIHGFVKRMEHERAVELYHRMLKDRVKPDVYTFNILISSYCRNSLFGLALREMKYDDAVQMAYEMIDLRCELSCATCEILVSGLCKGGKIIEACDLVVEFGGKGVLPNVFDCSDLVEMLCVRGAVLRALEVVDELWRKGYKPSLIASITLLEGLRKSQKLEEALRFTENILRENITP
ncbi:unnamed protein product [Rhodiola kirilowii]